MPDRLTIVGLAVAAFLFIGFFMLARLSNSDVITLEGEVVSRATNQGVDGSGDIYVVSTDGGGKVTVTTQVQKGIVRGERVKVNGHGRYVFSPLYFSIEKIVSTE